MKTLSEYELEVYEAFENAENYSSLAEKLIGLSNDGNPSAMFSLGSLYEGGHGVEQNNTNALAYYVRADQMGLQQAKYQIGVIAEFGRCGVSQSYEVAAKVYEEASDLGHADAQIQLGGLYERGYGVEKNLDKAFRYYKSASDNDNARAKFLLADCYMNGIGTEKSVTEALSLHHQAAELGHDQSQLILALKYKHGDDVPCDHLRAYKYANMAYENTKNESDKAAALSLRDEIYQLMSDTDKKSVLG